MKGIPLDPGNAEPIRIAVRIPAGVKAEFEAACAQDEISMSDMIRELVGNWLVERPRPNE